MTKKVSAKLKEFVSPQRSFEHKHQRAIGLGAVPKFAPPLARKLAASSPWTGEEHLIDTSSRMLHDASKPVKVDLKKRVSNARENVIDYRLNKQLPSNRTSKASSGLSSGGWIESVANSEIENAIQKGGFDNLPRNGENVNDTQTMFIESSRNPQLDLSSYLLNNIIRKQGGAPPWILKQIQARDNIRKFRSSIVQSLRSKIVHQVVADAKHNGDQAIALAKSGKYTRQPEWEQHYRAYHETMVLKLNQQIRGYNLQAPSATRWGYLDLTSELERCFATVLNEIDEPIKRFVGELKVPKISSRELYSSLPPTESREKHYGLKQLFRDLFARSKD